MASNLVQYVNLNYFVPDVEEAQKRALIDGIQIVPGVDIDLFGNDGIIKQGEQLLSTNTLGNNKNDGVEKVLDTMINKIAPAEAEMLVNLLQLSKEDAENFTASYIGAVTSDDVSNFKNTTARLTGFQINGKNDIPLPQIVQYAFYGDIAKGRFEGKETPGDIFLDIVRAKEIETIFKQNGGQRYFPKLDRTSSVRGYKFKKEGRNEYIELFSKDASRPILQSMTKKSEIGEALDYELAHNQTNPPSIETLEGIDYTIHVEKKTAKAYNIIVTFKNLDDLVRWQVTPISEAIAEEKGLPSATPIQVQAKTSDISSFFLDASSSLNLSDLLNQVHFTDEEIKQAVLEQYHIDHLTDLITLNEGEMGQAVALSIGQIGLGANILSYLREVFIDIEDFDKDLKEVSWEILRSLKDKIQGYRNFNAKGGSVSITIPLPNKLINTTYLDVATGKTSNIGSQEAGQEAVSVYWGCIESLFDTGKCDQLCAEKNVRRMDVDDYVKKIGNLFLNLNKTYPGRVAQLLEGARATKQDAIGYFTEEMFAILMQLIAQERGIPLEVIKARAAGKEREEGYQGQADIETEWGGIQAKAYPSDTFTFTFYKDDDEKNLTNYPAMAKYLGLERAITLAGFIRNTNTWNEMAKFSSYAQGSDPYVDFTPDTIKKIMDLWIPSFMRFSDAKYIGEELDKVINENGTKLRSKSVLFFSINYNIVPMSMIMNLCKQNANEKERFLIGPEDVFVKDKDKEDGEMKSSVTPKLPDARILSPTKGMANLLMTETLPFYYKFSGFKVRLKDILGDGNILFS